MSVKYLFDTNSIINIIEKKPNDAISVFRDQFLSVLSFYELGNVIWKLVHRKLIDENNALKLCDTFTSLWNSFKIIQPDIEQIKDILLLAIQQKITFYDASFIHYVRTKHLSLVTDDARMNEIAKKLVTVVSSDNLLSKDEDLT